MVTQNRPSLLSRGQNLSYNATLAIEIGDRQATLLQQIQYWLELNQRTNNPGHYRDGRWWTYNTYEDWQSDNFPHWSITTIRRLVNDLEKRGLVLSCQPYKSSGNQTKWYSIDYEAYAELEEGIYNRLEAETLISPEVSILDSRLSKVSSRVSKMDNSYIDPETTPENSSEISPPRTAFSSKSAHTHEEEVFSDFDQEQLKDNCTSTCPNDSAGQIPNSEKSEPRSGCSKKSNKPKPEKRKKFDGTFGLSCDRNGWIELPKVRDTVAPFKERMSLARTQAMLWMKVWFVGHYSDELDLCPQYDYESNVLCSISGKDFDEMPYDSFLGVSGPMPVRLMRDVLASRIGGFQEVFNEQMNDYFWQAWHKFSKQSA